MATLKPAARKPIPPKSIIYSQALKRLRYVQTRKDLFDLLNDLTYSSFILASSLRLDSHLAVNTLYRVHRRLNLEEYISYVYLLILQHKNQLTPIDINDL